MGCAASGFDRTMSLFGKRSQNTQHLTVKEVERKLYLAKESPEPVFDISECQLRALPTGIFSICKVYRKDNLYLHHNRLRSLEEGGQLSDLHLIKILDISFNCFVNLPNSIRYLASLTELYVQNNYMETLPDALKYLQCLQVLDISCNHLKNLNPEIGKLKYLSKLNITDNKDLHTLCPELCFATSIIQLDLDYDQFSFPPSEITSKGTSEIMVFLCNHMNIKYVPPQSIPRDTRPSPATSMPSPFQKQLSFTWEEQEVAIKDQENKLHKANQQQREKFLSEILQNQHELDQEIAKAHESREMERQKLLKCIQADEETIECLLKNFIKFDRLNPEIIQQQLAYEQAEHDHLMEITRKNYDNIRKADVLKATEQLIEKDTLIQFYKKHYIDNLNNMKKTILLKESEGAIKIANILNCRNESRSEIVQKLLEDQDVQQTVVSSLLDRVDAKSWSLNQEISLISSHLARLSIIEQEKKKEHIAYNYNEFLQHRIQLVNLLDDLFQQRKKRKQQLLATLKEAENEASTKTDFWLRSYQKLLDSAPKRLFDVGKLDPIFANYLIQEGVIHCLPFLVKFLFSGQSLSNITHEDLKQNGVTLSSDRDSIIRAINQYVESKICIKVHNDNPLPSAPPIDNDKNCSGVLNENDNSNTQAECVICMDSSSEVVFIPCGHMCCCQSCSESELKNCPMCRANIERTIKVLLVM